jgi:hypothetical protein
MIYVLTKLLLCVPISVQSISFGVMGEKQRSQSKEVQLLDMTKAELVWCGLKSRWTVKDTPLSETSSVRPNGERRSVIFQTMIYVQH